MNDDPYAGIRTRLHAFGVNDTPATDAEAAIDPAWIEVAYPTVTEYMIARTVAQEQERELVTGRRGLFTDEGRVVASRYLGRPIVMGRLNGRSSMLGQAESAAVLAARVREERRDRDARDRDRDARDRDRQRREEENHRRRQVEEQERRRERERALRAQSPRIPGEDVPAERAVFILRRLVEDMVHDWSALNEIYSNTARNRGWCSDYEDRCESYNEQFRVLHLVGRPENWHGHNSCWRDLTGEERQVSGDD